MTSVDLYLDLLARSLTGDLRKDEQVHPPRAFLEGWGWSEEAPPPAETMVGLVRLDNLRTCLETVLHEDIEGDVIETGVWRGGTSIFMRGVLEAHGDAERHVVLADSFQGLPPPSHPRDEGLNLHELDFLAVSLEEVRRNFRRYDLLDHRVEFAKGWFRDTLPALSARTWALIRLDGDLYESTMDALENLYGNVSPGGFVVIDDFGAYDACRIACTDFRARHGIAAEIVKIDWAGSFWRKDR